MSAYGVVATKPMMLAAPAATSRRSKKIRGEIGVLTRWATTMGNTAKTPLYFVLAAIPANSPAAT